MQINSINNLNNSYKAQNVKLNHHISPVQTKAVSFGQDSFQKENSTQKSVFAELVSAIVEFVKIIANFIKSLFNSNEEQKAEPKEATQNTQDNFQDTVQEENPEKTATKPNETEKATKSATPVALLPAVTESTKREQALKKALVKPERPVLMQQQEKPTAKAETLMLPEGKKPVALLPAPSEETQEIQSKVQLALPEGKKPVALLPEVTKTSQDKQIAKAIADAVSPYKKDSLREFQLKALAATQIAQEAKETVEEQQAEIEPQEKTSTPKIIPVKIDSSKVIKPKQTTEVAEAKAEATGTNDGSFIIKPLEGFTKMDLGFHETGKTKFFKLINPDTNEEYNTWYNEDGSILCTDYVDKDNNLVRMYYYDREAKIPRKEERIPQNGDIEVTTFSKDGKIEDIKLLGKEKKNVIYTQQYFYVPNSDKVDCIKCTLDNGRVENIFLDENQKTNCITYQENGKTTSTEWFYDDGKNVKLQQIFSENGNVETNSFTQDGKIISSTTTNSNGETVESTKYDYSQDGKTLLTSKTTYYKAEEASMGNWYDSSITWYNESELPTAASFMKDGKTTRTVWYYEDGETHKTSEDYLADGHKQKINFDRKERWIDFSEYQGNDKVPTKVTKYIYSNNEDEDPTSAVTKYADGTKEHLWFGKNETLLCKRTEKNGKPVKCEWFYDDGVTLKAETIYNEDGSTSNKEFDTNGNLIAA